MPWLVILLFFGLFAGQVAEARDCPNPWCAMCARRFGPMPGYSLVDGPGWGRVVRTPVREAPAPLRTTIAPVVDATPHEVVRAALAAVSPRRDEVLYDLGCGDARVMIEAIRTYGCQAVGIEVDPMIAERARKNLTAAGIPKRWRVVLGDARHFKLHLADIAFLYQRPELMEQLVPKLTNARAIISYSHEIPGRVQTRLDVAGQPVYLATELSRPVVNWPRIEPCFPTLQVSGVR